MEQRGLINKDLIERVAKTKYYKQGETWESMSRRVAKAAASGRQKRAERTGINYERDISFWEESYYTLINSKTFLPGGRILANAGTAITNLSNCYVLSIEDSKDDIYTQLANVAKIHAQGGGTGIDFSNLREKGAKIKTTGGESSGPVSFMQLFNLSGEVIKQGSRRAAMLAALDATHPDIFKFIAAKLDEKKLRNFNISVKLSDAVLQAYQQDTTIALKSPLGYVTSEIRARDLIHTIAEKAWKTGEPGILFIDTINKANTFPEGGALVATNPCGEIPGVNGSSCTLGSINLIKFLYRQGDHWNFNFNAFANVVTTAVEFLNDILEISFSGLELFDTVKDRERKIGLGVMGWADILTLLRVPYTSEEALELAESIGLIMRERAEATSRKLASIYGPFYPGYERYNSALLAIAPTGTLSLVSGVNYATEPFFALAYRKNFKYGNDVTVESNVIYSEAVYQLLQEEFDADTAKRILYRVAETGTLTPHPEFSEKINSRICDLHPFALTAHEISPEARIQMQAAWQRCVDQSISSTINLPNAATIEDVEKIILEAWNAGLKGITVFRDGCRSEQILEKI